MQKKRMDLTVSFNLVEILYRKLTKRVFKYSLMKKGVLFFIHSVAGLCSGLFILLLSVSGAILVFHEELDTFQKPVVGVEKTKKALLTLDSCYQVLRTHYPGAQVSHAELAATNAAAFSFFIYDRSYREGAKALQVFIHPTSGKILASRGGSDDTKHNMLSWLSGFHNSFQMGKKGEWMLGFFAFVFLISIITGNFLYRKKILAVLLFKKSIFKRSNLHQIIGTWALLFNLMIGITGFWMQRYVFKKEFYQLYDYTPVLKASPPLLYNFDTAYQRIKEKFPAFTGHIVYFAQNKKGKTALYGSNSTNSFIHSKKQADVIFLDSAGYITKTRFIDEIDAADRYDIINSQIHMGKYGGVAVKIIYSLGGLASGLLSITGFLLWVKRKRQGI